MVCRARVEAVAIIVLVKFGRDSSGNIKIQQNSTTNWIIVNNTSIGRGSPKESITLTKNILSHHMHVLFWSKVTNSTFRSRENGPCVVVVFWCLRNTLSSLSDGQRTWPIWLRLTAYGFHGPIRLQVTAYGAPLHRFDHRGTIMSSPMQFHAEFYASDQLSHNSHYLLSVITIRNLHFLIKYPLSITIYYRLLYITASLW